MIFINKPFILLLFTIHLILPSFFAFDLSQPQKTIQSHWYARRKFKSGVISYLKYPYAGRSYIFASMTLEISIQQGIIVEKQDNPQLYINLYKYNGPFINNTLLHCAGSILGSSCIAKSYSQDPANYNITYISQEPIIAISVEGNKQVIRIFQKDSQIQFYILFLDILWVTALVYWVQSLNKYRINQWVYIHILIVSFFSMAPYAKDINYGLQFPNQRYKVLYLGIVCYGLIKILYCIFSALAKKNVQLECFCKMVIFNIIGVITFSSNVLYFVFGSIFLISSLLFNRNQNIKMSLKYPLSMILGMSLLFLKYNLMQNCNYFDEITLFQSQLILFFIWCQYGILWIICYKDRDPYEVQFLDCRNKNNDNDCSICLTFIDGQAAKTPCGHIFHYQCLKSWAQMKNQCPIDRNKIHFPYVKVTEDTQGQSI